MRALVNDVSLSWYRIGRGRPVVLIHGLADDHRAWRKVLPALVMDHDVLLYDLRGHGQSELGAADGSLRQLSDDLISLMHVVDVPAAVLVGFSLGGTVAMRAALDHPDRVAGLALIGTSSRVNSAAADWYKERAEAADRRDVNLRTMLDRDTEDVYRQCPEEIPEGLLIRRQSTSDPRGYANACRAMMSLHDAPLDGELHQVRARTVLVAGDRDQHCPPRASEIIAAGIKESHVRVLGGAGHPLPVERPDEIAEEVRRLSIQLNSSGRDTQ